MSMPSAHRSFAEVRSALIARQEIALLDVREEDPHAQAHPLFAANCPLGRIEVEAYAKLPRREVPIVVFGAGEADAEIAAQRIAGLGYGDVSLLADGLAGWRDAGGELFRDVNVPSKAFGELVDAERHTPSLAAEEVRALIDRGADIVIVDARRFDEYQTMSIPGATSVPGAELVLRLPQLAPRAETRVIVNCAGRTRSIIGAQSLINAGLPNPVAALRNGTIGWTLAGQTLEGAQQRRFGTTPESDRLKAAASARAVADRAGVRRVASADFRAWHAQQGRTSYFFDVRTPEEYLAGHLPVFRSVPGGQLVQETEMLAPVRGARIVLADDDGVRANMSASWLAQMAWEVYVVDDLCSEDFSERGAWQAPLPPLPDIAKVDAASLAAWLARGDTAVLDLSTSSSYLKGHLKGAWFVLRSQLADSLRRIPPARRYVLTCPNGSLAHFAAAELEALVKAPVWVLDGGTDAWCAAGFGLDSGPTRMAAPAIDRYRRPYEGTDSPREAMQAYLDWEYGLVAQLARDAMHHFRVI
jgi:rhodanese-related sulfurtransferase